MHRAILSLALVGLAVAPACAADALTLSFAGSERHFTAAELLARPDAALIELPDDVSYKRAMRYRAVPLLALIGDAAVADFATP